MSAQTLSKAMDMQCLQDTEKPINIAWLGGEALTIPIPKLIEYREIINKKVPHAKNRLITNLYSLTNEQIDFIKDTFYSIETTYAAGLKMTLGGDEDKYQERFARNLKRLNDHGILCHVNVELNDRTVKAGVDHILELARETGQTSWEFDISIEFDKIFAGGVKVNPYMYADEIPLTISYKQWADYVIQFVRDRNAECKELGLRIGFIGSCFANDSDPFFNTMKTADYLSINPNGDVLGAPVFAAIPAIHYGNIHKNTEEEILSHPTKLSHTAWEQIGRFSSSDCSDCPYYTECRGGFSCVPIHDGSGECIGMKSVRNYIENYKAEYELNPEGLWNPAPTKKNIGDEAPCDHICHKCPELQCEDRKE